MRKLGELKMSLSNPRGGKILNSTMSGGESKGVRKRLKRVFYMRGGLVRLRMHGFHLEGVECGGMVRLGVHGICNCRGILKSLEGLRT